MAAVEALAPIGHNQPDPIAVLLDGLAARHEDLTSKIGLIEDAYTRVPAEINDDEWLAKTTQFVKAITDAVGAAEAKAKLEKGPIEGQLNAVRGWFAGRVDRLKAIKKEVQSRQSAYGLRKQDAERRAREAAAEQARAQAAAAAAQPVETEEQLLAQLEAEDTAATATKAAAAPAADLTRVRSEHGAVGSMRDHWTFRIVDPAAIPRQWCQPDEKLIRQAVTKGMRPAADGAQPIPGVEIFNDQKFVSR